MNIFRFLLFCFQEDRAEIPSNFSLMLYFLHSRICRSKKPLSIEAQIGLSYTVEKSCLFRLDLPVEKLSRKSYTRVLKPIASRIPPQSTHPHTHTRYHTAVSYNSANTALAVTAVASRRKSAWRIPSSARKQRGHTTTAARGIDAILPTTATPAVSLAGLGRVQRYKRSFSGFRLKSNATNPLGQGFIAREAQSCQPIFDCHTAVQRHSLTPTASRKSTPSHQISERLPINSQPQLSVIQLSARLYQKLTKYHTFCGRTCVFFLPCSCGVEH